MRRIGATLAAAAAVSIAAPASAGTIFFDNGGSSYQASKTFTNGDVYVKVSAFSINDSSKVESAWLGSWSGNGMGVLNKQNDGSHTIDNQGFTDFVVLVFDQAVTLDTAWFNTGYYGTLPSTKNEYYNDTDATIGYLNNASFDVSSLLGDSKSTLSSLFSVYASNSTANGDQHRDINGGDHTANVWLIGAAFSNPDQKRDGFKIKKLSYEIPPPAVPEPATWALMILGFGLVGGAMRRHRPSTNLTFA